MKFIYLLLILPILSIAQPLKNKHEITLERSKIDLYSCKEVGVKCVSSVDTKLSVNLITGTTGDFQYAGIFRLNKDEDKSSNGAIGGQVWKKVNDRVWLGTEVASDLDFNISNEILIAVDALRFKSFQATIYTSIDLANSSLANVGVKFYIDNTLTVTLEADISLDENKDHRVANELKIGVGFIIKDKNWQDLKKLLEDNFGLDLN